MNKKVLIIGGGFAGIKTARQLDKISGESLDITLISNKDYFEYYPALYRLVTGTSPIEACVPLTEMLFDTNVQTIKDAIISIDPNTKTVVGASGTTYTADYLILALGSETAYFDLPGLSELSFGFKSVNEALKLKQHIHNLFVDHVQTSVSESVSHFHIVIVGGGASGVEIAGDLVSFLKTLTTSHEVDPSLITIDLIESAPRLLQNINPKVSARVEKRLRSIGVNIYLNRSLVKEEVEEVYLKDMSLRSKTVVWTAGTRVNKLYATIPGFIFNKKGKVSVDSHLQPVSFNGVYVIGDAADTPYSGLAQTAIYDGTYIAKTIMNDVHGVKTKEYKPKATSYSIPVGDNWGVLSIGKFQFYGYIPYIIRHVIDFMFFSGIVSARKLFSMYREGWKYRKIDKSCKNCNI